MLILANQKDSFSYAPPNFWEPNALSSADAVGGRLRRIVRANDFLKKALNHIQLSRPRRSDALTQSIDQ